MKRFQVRGGRLLLPLIFLAAAFPPAWSQSKLDTTKVVDFMATNEQVQDVMALLGQDLNIRIVVSPQVRGTVNANIPGEVTLRAVLDSVLPALGANYYEEGGIINIVTQAEHDAKFKTSEQLITRSFTLRQRRVEDAKPIVEVHKTKDGIVTLDVEDNSITVTDTAAAVAKIEEEINRIENKEIVSRVFKIENAELQEVVTRLKEALAGDPEIIVDERLKLIVIRSTQDNIDKAEQIIEIIDAELPLAIYSINFLKRDEVGDLLEAIRNIVGDDLKKLSFQEGSRRLLVEAPPNKLKKIAQIIEAWDIFTRQVFIVCEVIEVGANDEFSLGVDWTIGDDVGRQGLVGAATDAPPITNILGGTRDLTQLGTSGFDLFFLKPREYLLTIKALKSRSDTRTLSSPRLLVRDGGRANFNDGGSEPISSVQSGYYDSRNDPFNTGGIYSNVRDKVVGLQLNLDDVHVSDNGYVELTINLNDEQVLQRIEVGNNQTGVRTSRIEIDTELVLKDHHTAVMGGVLRRRKSIDRKGVPLLGEIPLLGFPFRSTGRQEDQRRLLLFVTPHIINIENPFDMDLADDKAVFKFYRDQNLVDWRDEDELRREAERRAALRAAGVDPDADRPAVGEAVETGGRIAVPARQEPPEEVMTIAPGTPEETTPPDPPEILELPGRRSEEPALAPDEPGRVRSLTKRALESEGVWDPGVRLSEVLSDKEAVFLDARGRKLKVKVGDRVGRTARLLSADPASGRVRLQHLTTAQEAEMQAETR